MILFIGLIYGQEVQVSVAYQNYEMEDVTYKVAIAKEMTFSLNERSLKAEMVQGDVKQWQIKNEQKTIDAVLVQDSVRGIWWELTNDTDTIRVKLSRNSTDFHDPDNYVLKSTTSRSIYRVINEERDCNSSFVLMEAAESPTLLTGVAKTLAFAENKKPCGKGKWKVSVENEVPENVMLAFLFSSVQALNVRYLEEL